MLRKIFICLAVLFFLFLIVLPVFADKDEIYTSEGWYTVNITYLGLYMSQVSNDYLLNYENRHPFNKLSNGQLEAINKMLSRYRCSTGDTFSIIIRILGQNGFYGYPIWIICEFTSSSRYIWWAYS